MKLAAEPMWGEPPLITVIRKMEIADVIRRSLAAHRAEQDLHIQQQLKAPSK